MFFAFISVSSVNFVHIRRQVWVAAIFFFQNSNSTPVCYLPTFLNYDIWCGCLACACIVKSTKIYPHIDSYVFSLSSRNHSFVVMVHFALKIKRLLCNGSYDIHKMKWMWTYASVCERMHYSDKNTYTHNNNNCKKFNTKRAYYRR